MFWLALSLVAPVVAATAFAALINYFAARVVLFLATAVEVSGLVSYGIDSAEVYHWVEVYVARILKGTKPSTSSSWPST